MVEDARSRGLLQERTFSTLKSVIPRPEFQDALSTRDTSRVSHDLDRAMAILSPVQHRNLAVYILNGISQRLPDQTWNPSTQMTALSVFSRINFNGMPYTALMSVRDSYLHTVHASLIDKKAESARMGLLSAGWHLLPHLGEASSVTEPLDITTYLALSIFENPKVPDVDEKAVLSIYYKDHLDEKVDDIRGVLMTRNATTRRARVLQRRVQVFLNHTKYAKDVAAELDVSVDDVNNDLVLLTRKRFVDKKAPGTRTDKDKMAMVLQRVEGTPEEIATDTGLTVKQVEHYLHVSLARGMRERKPNRLPIREAVVPKGTVFEQGQSTSK